MIRKNRFAECFSSTGTLACAVLLHLRSMHSKECLCYLTFSAGSEACRTRCSPKDENRQAEACPTGYFAGLGVAGFLILCVNSFSCDHTQGDSGISTPGRSFMIRCGVTIGLV